MPTLAVPSSIMRVRSRVLRAQWRTSKYWLFSSASRSVRASTLPDCSKTAVGTCLTSVLIAQPKMNSIATGTKSMSVSARRSRPSWRNSLAMIPWSRLPTASALRGAERPELLAHPRLPLAVHERDEHVLHGRLDLADPVQGHAARGEVLPDGGDAGPTGRDDQPHAGAGAHDLLDRVPVGERGAGGARVLGGQLDHRPGEGVRPDPR